MNSKTHSSVELSLKVIGGIVAIATLIFAVLKFEKTMEIASKEPFFTAKQVVYTELIDIAADIAVSEGEEQKLAFERFEHLRWGKLPMVQSIDVQDSVNCFLKAYQEKETPIRSNAYRLAYNLKVDLVNTWGLDRSEYVAELGSKRQPDNLPCYPTMVVNNL